MQNMLTENIIANQKLPSSYYRTVEVVLKSYSDHLSAFGLLDLEYEAKNVGQLQVNPNIQSTSKRSKSELHLIMADDE